MSQTGKKSTNAENMEHWAELVLPWLPPPALSAASSTCRSFRVAAAAVTSRRVADAARGLETYPIPFCNPTSDSPPYFYFLYSRFSFSSIPTSSQPWGGISSPPVAANPSSIDAFISSAAETNLFSGCECADCSLEDECSCSGFHGGGGMGMGSLSECGADCLCGLECANRITQKGIQVRLKIVRDLKKGWGLHADQVLCRGEFICEYADLILK
ncbi:Histone-lysine N-methyltransferase SUVR3 [Platanthera zijinensis]|uniref:Histone-lysine N-methyltransferase SUVR3 n=1 Tax=Platanthera zijinensis TaxID=2320716 RepID=A0AAP0BMC3_9ASPA